MHLIVSGKIEKMLKIPLEVEMMDKETKQAPSISTAKSRTMMELILVNSPSKTLPQDIFNDFEKYTTGISSKFMRQMGYASEEIGNEGQGIMMPIVAQYDGTCDSIVNLTLSNKWVNQLFRLTTN